MVNSRNLARQPGEITWIKPQKRKGNQQQKPPSDVRKQDFVHVSLDYKLANFYQETCKKGLEMAGRQPFYSILFE